MTTGGEYYAATQATIQDLAYQRKCSSNVKCFIWWFFFTIKEKKLFFLKDVWAEERRYIVNGVEIEDFFILYCLAVPCQEIHINYIL